jgi:hypothetical protein
MGGKTKDGRQKNPNSRWVKGNPRYSQEQETRFAASRSHDWHSGARVRRPR